MSDPSLTPPDWESVFHRARRRIFGRLLIVGTVAALGATLLLSGGLSAQGSVTWGPLPGHADEKNDNDSGHKRRSHDKHGKKGGKGSDGDGGSTGRHGQSGHRKQKHHKKDKKSGGKHGQWHPCGGSSAGVQYCDAPPTSPSDKSSGATGVTGVTGATGVAATPAPRSP